MSSAAVRRAQTVSRMAMSPGNALEDDSLFSVLNEAKEELKKEKKQKVLVFSFRLYNMRIVSAVNTLFPTMVFNTVCEQ